jgi:hypothetical protein
MFCLLREIAQVSYVFNFHVEHAFFNLEERYETSRTSRVRLQQRLIPASNSWQTAVWKLVWVATLVRILASNPNHYCRLLALLRKAHFIRQDDSVEKLPTN